MTSLNTANKNDILSDEAIGAITGGLNLHLHPLPQGQALWERLQDTLRNFAVNQFIRRAVS